MRRPKCASYRMVDKRGSRRRDFAHDIVSRAGDERRDALTFEDVGDETDRLMAERSVGHEQGEIDLSIRQFSRQRRRELVLNGPVLAHAAHERIMVRREAPNDAAPS
jgi:hypothetical protein